MGLAVIGVMLVSLMVLIGQAQQTTNPPGVYVIPGTGGGGGGGSGASPVLVNPATGQVVWPPYFWSSNSLAGVSSTNVLYDGTIYGKAPYTDAFTPYTGPNIPGFEFNVGVAGDVLDIFSNSITAHVPFTGPGYGLLIASSNIVDAVSLVAGSGIAITVNGTTNTITATGTTGSIWKNCYAIKNLPELTHFTASAATPVPFDYEMGIQSDGSGSPIMGAVVPYGFGFSTVISTVTIQGLTGETNMTCGLVVYTKSYPASGRVFNSANYTVTGITNGMLLTLNFTNTFQDDVSPRMIDFDFGAVGQTVSNTLQIIDWSIKSSP